MEKPKLLNIEFKFMYEYIIYTVEFVPTKDKLVYTINITEENKPCAWSFNKIETATKTSALYWLSKMLNLPVKSIR